MISFFEREIDVSGTRLTEIGYLSLYPNILEVWLLFYQSFQEICYLTNAADNFCWH